MRYTLGVAMVVSWGHLNASVGVMGTLRGCHCRAIRLNTITRGIKFLKSEKRLMAKAKHPMALSWETWKHSNEPEGPPVS